MRRGILDEKTVGEVFADPAYVRQALSTLGPLTKARLWLRQVKRIGAWARAHEQGLSDEKANAMVQLHHPSTIWDSLYEIDYKRRKLEHPAAIRAGNLIDAETMVSSEETIGTLKAAAQQADNGRLPEYRHHVRISVRYT
jgi:hypothetical protein